MTRYAAQTTVTPARSRVEIEARLTAKRVIDRTRECWLWTGAKTRNGYGQIYFRGKLWLVHRVAAVLWLGWDGIAGNVLHACDVRNCFNPDHLSIGTQRENLIDASLKGRLCRGSRIRQSRLTEADVVKIRGLRAVGTTQQAIADRFGVSQGTISYAVRNLTWKHVSGETVGEWLAPQLEAAYRAHEMPPLLPGLPSPMSGTVRLHEVE